MADKRSYTVDDVKNYLKGNTLFDEYENVEYPYNSQNYPSSSRLRSKSISSEESSLGILDMDAVSDLDSNISRNNPNARNTSNTRHYVNCVDPIEKDMEWQQRRPKAVINFSDIIEEKTIDGRMTNFTPTSNAKIDNIYTFEPIEMTGRSTTCIQAQVEQPPIGIHSPSVAEILASSFATDIRDLCTSMQSINKNDMRNSLSARNIDKLDNGHQGGIGNSNRGFVAVSYAGDQASNDSDEFKPAEEMRSQLLEDEKKWEDEFGLLPSDPTNRSSKVSSTCDGKSRNGYQSGKYLNLTEFSGYVGENSGRGESGGSNLSMGNFFSTRCEDVRDMIPALSPRKRVKPVALLHNTDSLDFESSIDDKYSVVSSSFYTDDELRIRSQGQVDNATYDKPTTSSVSRASIFSLSTIARHLNDAGQSPATVVEKLMENRKVQPQANKPSEILKPLDDQVLYMTKPVAFEKPTNSGKIDVLNVEKFYGNHPDWEKFRNAETVSTIGAKPSRLLSSTRENTANSNKPDDVIRAEMNANKENYNKRQNFTADTASFSESNLDFSDSSSFEFDSASESNTSPRRHRAHYGRMYGYQQANNGAVEVPAKRARSPLPKSQQTSTPLGVHSMASAPLLRCTAQSIQSPNKYSKNEHVSKHLSPARNLPMDDDFDQLPRHFPQISSPRSKLSLPNFSSSVASSTASSTILSSMRLMPHQNAITAVPVTRSSSQCSTNSEFSPADGRFPLKSSKGELVWDCTELRSTAIKKFTIKNTAAKRISLKIEINGPGFQLSGIDLHNTLIMHAGECRTISVVFCPTVQGRAKGKVVFKPTKVWTEDITRSVQLYGYGGRTTLQLQGLERGPVGLQFLKLGDTSNLRAPMSRSFMIYNSGPLNGVAYIGIKPESGQHLTESSISIQPNKCVIRPNSYATIKVTYNLRRKDIVKFLQKGGEVFQVGILEVITGSEANRLRLAALLQKASVGDMYKVLDFLIKDFPVVSDEKFDTFGESAENISDIFSFFRQKEMALTVNKNTLDETRESERDLQYSGIEESLMFRTLQPDSTTSDIDFYQNDGYNNGLASFTPDGTWNVYPNSLRFDARNNTMQTISIRNNFSKPQTFQLDSNAMALFSFSQNSGRIEPGRELNIDVTLKQTNFFPQNILLTVYIESDSVEIPVEIRAGHVQF